jgi:hypothetical protein
MPESAKVAFSLIFFATLILWFLGWVEGCDERAREGYISVSGGDLIYWYDGGATKVRPSEKWGWEYEIRPGVYAPVPEI